MNQNFQLLQQSHYQAYLSAQIMKLCTDIFIDF